MRICSAYNANMGESGNRLKITVGTMINGKLEFIETLARRNGEFWTIDLPATFLDQPTPTVPFATPQTGYHPGVTR